MRPTPSPPLIKAHLSQVQATAGTHEMMSEEYQQLNLRCWSKFYTYCLEYQELVCKPLALFQDPGTGMGLVLKQGALSFLRPTDISEDEDGGGVELSLLRSDSTRACRNYAEAKKEKKPCSYFCLNFSQLILLVCFFSVQVVSFVNMWASS